MEKTLRDRPFVSVVIAARNAAAHLEDCLQSVLGQQYPRDAYEVIVVDNGSTDDTAAIAARLGVRVVTQPRPGVARARNAGVLASRGEIVAFVDSDCVAEPDWLGNLLAGAEDPKVGCLAGVIIARETDHLLPHWFEYRRFTDQARLLSFTPPVAAGANVAYRRRVFETVGLYDERFFAAEDNDIFWRMLCTDRFIVRFQQNARVRHAHPRRFRHVVRRAFVEGRGLALFRWKHRKDFCKRYTEVGRNIHALILNSLALFIYPQQVVQEVRRGLPLSRCLVYPLLDTAYYVSRSTGMLREILRARFTNALPDMPPLRMPSHE